MRPGEEQQARIAEAKQRVKDEIDARRNELTELSLRIHDKPELGHEEVKASTCSREKEAKSGFF